MRPLPMMRQKSHCQGKKCPLGVFAIVPKRSEIAKRSGKVQDYILGKVFVIISCVESKIAK